MKSIITISSLLLLLASCSSIYFQEVQPKGGVYQTEMPNDLYGIWFGETEGWQINEHGITNIDFKTDSLDNIIDTLYNTTPLSDSLRVYRVNDLYVLNSRENSQYWEIVIFQPKKNGDIYLYYISDPKIFASIKGLKLEEASYYIDGELRKVKTVTPEWESSLKFDDVVFSGQMKVKSLRKVLSSLPPTILKNDSTVFVAENDSI